MPSLPPPPPPGSPARPFGKSFIFSLFCFACSVCKHSKQKLCFEGPTETIRKYALFSMINCSRGEDDPTVIKILHLSYKWFCLSAEHFPSNRNQHWHPPLAAQKKVNLLGGGGWGEFPLHQPRNKKLVCVCAGGWLFSNTVLECKRRLTLIFLQIQN